jgi:hypothetical protein
MHRRRFLGCGAGLLGLSLAETLALRPGSARASERSFGRAKRCLAFFAWGGMSQLETFDPKPEAPSEFRGDYRCIATSVPGIHIGEYLPRLARETHRMTIVRSVHHRESGHRNAAYWNLTGHQPHTPGNDTTILPSRKDWPSLGSMAGAHLRGAPGLPSNVAIPHMLADRGLVNGQTAGFLGSAADPVLLSPEGGTPYEGVSPPNTGADLRFPFDLSADRLLQRQSLLGTLPAGLPHRQPLDHYREVASNLLTRPQVSAAFDLDRELIQTRDAYGPHQCGKATLLGRRLLEAGVPFVMVYPGAGDLNGGSGDMWDTHGSNFTRLRNKLLPPLERASCALLEDLSQRGMLDDTLVVWFTEFGRTPRVNGSAGRDHFPNCYSVAFAGAGVRQGYVYGRSDAVASTPTDMPCSPADLHATVFHALGIPGDTPVRDSLGREYPLCDGRPLPIFA